MRNLLVAAALTCLALSACGSPSNSASTNAEDAEQATCVDPIQLAKIEAIDYDIFDFETEANVYIAYAELYAPVDDRISDAYLILAKKTGEVADLMSAGNIAGANDLTEEKIGIMVNVKNASRSIPIC